MTKDDIISLPHPALRTKSKKVGLITDDIRHIIKDMESATIDWEASRAHEVGVALAAIQINQPFRIVVIRDNYDNKDDHNFTVLINPEITKLEGQIIEDFEGCLSVKDIYGKVARYEKVRVKATGLDGKPLRLSATGFLARILQHEIDHCSGIVFIDHIKDKPEAFFRLQDDGKLEPLDYDKDVNANPALWSE